ncbi:MAG: hypothetical protein HZY73_06580 [Micropruina sp.]|nr:MAG: hypothetical protein HZY73_06580 [Micropruina sp.]
MPIALLVMIVILVLALAIVAIVAIGMRGAGRERVPELANVMAETARHLNGDAEPPQRLRDFFDEIEDVRKSAATASSAQSAS